MQHFFNYQFMQHARLLINVVYNGICPKYRGLHALEHWKLGGCFKVQLHAPCNALAFALMHTFFSQEV